MPKIVDHDERRQELVEATWRVIARTGIVGVTTREIAREAGVSTGILAHYFGDKEELLATTLRLSHRQVYDRLQVRTQGLMGIAALRVIMLEALPLDDQRLLQAEIQVNFWSPARQRGPARTAARRVRALLGRIALPGERSAEAWRDIGRP